MGVATARGRRAGLGQRQFLGPLLGLPALALAANGLQGLVPERRVAGQELDVEVLGVAELEHLDAVRTGRIGVGSVAGDEETVACAQGLGAQGEAAGDDVVEAIGVVAVTGQRKALLNQA